MRRPHSQHRVASIQQEARRNMDANSEFRVTLSEELLRHLRLEAEARHVPLRWLVAGLICDTLEAGEQVVGSGQSRCA